MANLEEHLIDSSKRLVLAEQYTNHNYAAINAARLPDEPDSREYTFDLSTLEEFLAYVKKAAATQSLTDVKIRISMGQYPDHQFDERLKHDYRGHQTIFLEGGTADEEGFHLIQEIEGLNFSHLKPPPYD